LKTGKSEGLKMARSDEKKRATVVRKVANAALMSDGRIRVSNVRLSYPHLDKPYKKEGDAGVAKYGVVGLLPKDTHKAAKKLIDEEIARVMQENKVKALAGDKKFLRDGDESDKEEHNGHWTLSAREERRPILKDMNEDGDLILVEQEDVKETFYGGCWGSLLVEPWFQNNKHGKRVNASLRAVTKKADDEAFGEGRMSEEDADAAFEDDDEFEAPRRGSSSKKPSRYEDDDEEEERPRRRRPARDEDEDDDDL
jgi:hypothetical protein